ncbi:MAG: FHA domain-containing protein [Candidatus Methanomethylicaceae archaeon]
MLRVIIHVIHQEHAQGTDVEVPAEVPIKDLTYLLARALNWENSAHHHRYVVRTDPEGPALPPHASLADLGLWDGTTLFFEPITELAHVDTNPQSPNRSKAAALVTESGHRYKLAPNISYTIGRSSVRDSQASNLIDLRNERMGHTVSRHHADLFYGPLGWILISSPSAQNQTQLNGEPVQPAQPHLLHHTDLIQLGGVKLRFELE